MTNNNMNEHTATEFVFVLIGIIGYIVFSLDILFILGLLTYKVFVGIFPTAWIIIPKLVVIMIWSGLSMLPASIILSDEKKNEK